jgi:2-dehydropantoate 2-reductase
MKIALMATGAVGGYFGGKLALAGHEVTFIARGAHGAAIREHGLRVNSVKGDFVVKNATVTDDPATVGPVDIILFAVKLWATEEAALLCRPMVGPHTLVIPLQNGVGALDTVTGVLGAENVGGGIAKISAVISKPGVILHVSDFASIEFAEAHSQPSERTASFQAACVEAGFDAVISKDIVKSLWLKFIFLAALSGMTAATRQSVGPIIDHEEGMTAFRSCMLETVSLGQKLGVDLSDETVGRILKFVKLLPPTMKASQLNDLELGSRLEAPWLTGAICRMGREQGISTPVNDTIYAVLRPFVNGKNET